MEIRGVDLTYPRLLLAGLLLIIVTAGIIGLSTSSTAFGSYNPSWDGTSDARALASSTGATPELTQSTSVYTEATPSESTSFILSPTDDYARQDAARVTTFVENGGTVIVAADFDAHSNALLDDLGVTARLDGRLVRDEQQYYRGPDLPVATNVADTNLTRNVSRLTLNHATVVRPGPDSTVLVNTSGFAYLDANRNGTLDDAETLQERPVAVSEAVGEGRVIVVSDPSVFINAMLATPDNRQFTANLMQDTETVIFDYSHRSGVPWAVATVHTIADTPLLQLLVIGLLTGSTILAWRSEHGFDTLSEYLRPGSSATAIPVHLSEADVTARVTTRHPEWDADRVEHVARGIMSQASNTDEDD